MKPTGYPRLKTAMTTANLEKGLAVLSPRVLWSLGEIANAYLRTFTAPCALFISPKSKRIGGATDQAIIDYFNLAADTYNTKLILNTTSGQFLDKWNVVSTNGFPDLSGRFHANNRFTLTQVIDFLCSEFPTYFITVDQGRATVACYNIDDFDGDELWGDSFNGSGEIHTYDLEEKSVLKLAFE